MKFIQFNHSSTDYKVVHFYFELSKTFNNYVIFRSFLDNS